MRCLIFLLLVAFAAAESQNLFQRYVAHKQELAAREAIEKKIVDYFCDRGMIGDAWDWAKDKAGAAADWVKDKAGAAKDWACDKLSKRNHLGQREFSRELAARNWAEIERSLTEEEVRGLLDSIGSTIKGGIESLCNRDVIDDAINWVKDKAGDLKDWACGKLLKRQAALDSQLVARAVVERFCDRGMIGDAWDWVKDKAGDAADWVKDKAGAAKDWVCDKLSKRNHLGQREFSNELAARNWDEVERSLTEEDVRGLLDSIGSKIKGGLESFCNRGAVDDAIDWVKDKAGDLKDWACGKLLKRQAALAMDSQLVARGVVDYFCDRGMIGDAWDWVKDKAGDAADWVKDKAGAAKDWACDKLSKRNHLGQREFSHELAARNWEEIERSLTEEEVRGLLDSIGSKIKGGVESLCDRGVVDWVKDKAGDLKDWACGKLLKRK